MPMSGFNAERPVGGGAYWGAVAEGLGVAQGVRPQQDFRSQPVLGLLGSFANAHRHPAPIMALVDRLRTSRLRCLG